MILLFYFVFPANRNFALVPVSKSTLFFLTFKKLIYVLQTKKNLHCVKQIMILYQIFSVIFSWHANVAQRTNFKRTRSLGEHLLEISFWIKPPLFIFSLYLFSGKLGCDRRSRWTGHENGYMSGPGGGGGHKPRYQPRIHGNNTLYH